MEPTMEPTMEATVEATAKALPPTLVPTAISIAAAASTPVAAVDAASTSIPSPEPSPDATADPRQSSVQRPDATRTPNPTPSPTHSPRPTMAPTPTHPPTPFPTPKSPTSVAPYAELTPICSFDEPQRYLSCRAEGQSGGTLKWTSNVSSRVGFNQTFKIGFGWGEVFDDILVEVEECNGPVCSQATDSIDVALRPRGDCPDDFNGWFKTFPLDDISLVTEVGQPGRIGVNDYKGHGYFRVPNQHINQNVRLPSDATLYAGSRYLEGGEVQYLLFFRTPCEGVSFRFDHIAAPSTDIEALFTYEPKEGDSRTSEIGPLALREGDVVGTRIGVLGNVAVDFGVYDEFRRLPTPQHPNAGGLAAVCFYDFFDPETASTLRSRVGGIYTIDPDLC